jgi:hypothetical protein
MAQGRVWLSFDLGVQGDYSGFYVWLDEQEAEECGDSVATFFWTGTRESLTKALKKAVEFRKRDRVYLVAKVDGRHVGKFIVGGRKSAPWTGSASKPAKDDEEEE